MTSSELSPDKRKRRKQNQHQEENKLTVHQEFTLKNKSLNLHTTTGNKILRGHINKKEITRLLQCGS